MADVPLASVAAAEPTVKMVGRDGTEHYVPETQAADAYRSGQFGFADPSQRIAVRDSSGTMADLSAAQAANLWAKDSFAGSASMGELREANEAAKYGGIGNTLAAGAIGTGNALTVGLGRGLAVDAAGVFGGRDAELATENYLRRTEEASPVASMAGEAIGTIVPALLSGGTSAGVQGAVRGGSVGARVLSAGGRVLSAPTRALGLLGEGAAGLTGRGLALAGVEEGGLLARGLTSAARGSAEMSVYSAADAWSRAKVEDRDLSAEQLMAAAGHGALMGGALGGGLVLGGAALNKTLGGIGSGARKALEKGEELAESIGLRIPKADAVMAEQAIKSTGAIQSQVDRLVGNGVTKGMGKDVENRVTQIIMEELPGLAGKKSLATVSREAMHDAAKTFNQRVIGEQQALIKAADDAIIKHGTGAVDLEKVANKARAEVLSPAVDAAMLTSEKRGLKAVDSLITDVSNIARDGKTSIAEAHKLRKQIDGEIVYGKAEADLTNGARAINDAKKQLRWMVDDALSEAGQRALEKEGAEMSLKWSQIKTDLRASHWIEEATGKGASAELRNRSFSLGSMIAGGSGGNIGATAGAALAGPVGAFVGGVAGHAAGAVLGNLSKRFSNQMAATVAKRVVETDVLRAVDTTLRETMGASVTSLVRGVKAPSSAAVGSLVSKADAQQTRSKQADYEKRRQALVNFAAAPDATLARTLAGAPAEVVAGVKAQTAKGAEYLQSIAPRPVGTGNPLQPTSDVDKVDPAARDRWLRSARAVDDPMSVLSDARQGSLTPEAVAAVKAVYPRIYGQIQGQVMAELAKSDRPLSYSRAQQLSILLGVPADVSLTPAYLAAVQTPPTQAKPPKAGKIVVKNEPDKLGSQETET